MFCVCLFDTTITGAIETRNWIWKFRLCEDFSDVSKNLQASSSASIALKGPRFIKIPGHFFMFCSAAEITLLCSVERLKTQICTTGYWRSAVFEVWNRSGNVSCVTRDTIRSVGMSWHTLLFKPLRERTIILGAICNFIASDSLSFCVQRWFPADELPVE